MNIHQKTSDKLDGNAALTMVHLSCTLKYKDCYSHEALPKQSKGLGMLAWKSFLLGRFNDDCCEKNQ